MSTKLKAGTATSGAVLDADTAGILEIQTGSTPTTAVTIDASQNVGIGTASPTQKLQVYSSGASGGQIQITNASTQATSTDGVLFGFDSFNDVIINNQEATTTKFYTNSTERMRIDVNGNFLIGKTSQSYGTVGLFLSPEGNIEISRTSAGAQNIACNRTSTGNFVYFSYNTSQVGTISTNGSTTTYGTTSDYRLKENIKPMIGALNAVQQLKPVTYTWKSNGSDGQGFIAHELQEVVPDCVVGEKDAVDAEGNSIYQGIDTSFLVATLTAAIQELNAKVDAQAAEIQTLKGAPLNADGGKYEL